MHSGGGIAVASDSGFGGDGVWGWGCRGADAAHTWLHVDHMASINECIPTSCCASVPQQRQKEEEEENCASPQCRSILYSYWSLSAGSCPVPTTTFMPSAAISKPTFAPPTATMLPPIVVRTSPTLISAHRNRGGPTSRLMRMMDICRWCAVDWIIGAKEPDLSQQHPPRQCRARLGLHHALMRPGS